jgi:signal transduction histidine kinase
LDHASVLIVSDDTEFARSIVARWQAERHDPEITLVTSDVWHASSAVGHQLIVVGPVRNGKISTILASLEASPGTAAVCVTDVNGDATLSHLEHSRVLRVPRQDGWMGVLIAISNEALRRVEAVGRAQRAERLALENQRHAILGRFMLEMRPNVNNALTSVLGNADLLLLEPGQVSAEAREQIQTIHTMALRLNEIVQRFSSLASEMRAGEKDSQAETEDAAHRSVTGS